MAKGRRTDLPTAGRIKAMSDLGFSPGQISGATAINLDTVKHILNGSHGWREIYDDEVFAEYRLKQKRVMQAASTELSKKALSQIESKLGDASSLQAATVYGILRDKERLDAGEATQNIALHSKTDIEKLDELAHILSGSLVKNENN